jgi:hypothetical protein
MQSAMPATRQPMVRRRRIPFLRDIYNGAVRGDFAAEIGLAGALTQAALGFVPVVGTLCALRDVLADLRYRDRMGCLLNALALVPFLGGFPKTAEVIRVIHHAGHVVHVSHRRNRAEWPAPAPWGSQQQVYADTQRWR